jgi:sugar phosphate isomerase/epimerase
MTSRRIGISLSPLKSEFGPLLYSGNLELGLRTVSSLGYSGVELSLLDSSLIDPEQLADQLDEYKLAAYTIATGQTYYADGFSLFNAERERREKCVRRLFRHIDLAKRLNCMVIVGGIRGTIVATGRERSEQERDGLECLRRCALYAGDRNVVLLLEPVNRYETNVVNTIKEGLTLISEIDVPNLKLLPDTFHMNIEEANLGDALVSASSLVGYVHFADSNRLAPGWGHIDFANLLSALSKIEYAGPIGVEILPKPDDRTAAGQAIQHLRELSDHLLVGYGKDNR